MLRGGIRAGCKSARLSSEVSPLRRLSPEAMQTRTKNAGGWGNWGQQDGVSRSRQPVLFHKTQLWFSQQGREGEELSQATPCPSSPYFGPLREKPSLNESARAPRHERFRTAEGDGPGSASSFWVGMDQGFCWPASASLFFSPSNTSYNEKQAGQWSLDMHVLRLYSLRSTYCVLWTENGDAIQPVLLASRQRHEQPRNTTTVCRSWSEQPRVVVGRSRWLRVRIHPPRLIGLYSVN